MGSEKLNDLPKVTHPGSDREDREDDTHFLKGRRVVKMALGRLHSKDFFFSIYEKNWKSQQRLHAVVTEKPSGSRTLKTLPLDFNKW